MSSTRTSLVSSRSSIIPVSKSRQTPVSKQLRTPQGALHANGSVLSGDATVEKRKLVEKKSISEMLSTPNKNGMGGDNDGLNSLFNSIQLTSHFSEGFSPCTPLKQFSIAEKYSPVSPAKVQKSEYQAVKPPRIASFDAVKTCSLLENGKLILEEISQIRDDQADMCSSCEYVDNLCFSLFTLLQESQKEVTLLQQQLKAREGEAEVLYQGQERLQQQVYSQHDDKERLKLKYTALHEDLVTFEEEYASLLQKNTRLENEKQKTPQGKLDRGRRNSLTVIDNSLEVERLEVANEMLQEVSHGLQIDQQAERAKTEELEESLSKLQDRNFTLHISLEQQEQKVQSMEKQLVMVKEEHTERIETMEQVQLAQLVKIRQHDNVLKTLQEDLRDSLHEVHELRVEKTELQEVIDDLANNVGEQELENKTQLMNSKTAVCDNSKLDRDVDNLTQMLRIIQTEKQDIQKQYLDTVSHLEGVTKQNAGLQTQQRTERMQHAEKMVALREEFQFRSYKQRYHELLLEKATIQCDLEQALLFAEEAMTAQNEWAATVADMHGKYRELNTQKQQLSKKQVLVDTQKEEIDQLQADILELYYENEHLKNSGNEKETDYASQISSISEHYKVEIRKLEEQQDEVIQTMRADKNAYDTRLSSKVQELEQVIVQKEELQQTCVSLEADVEQQNMFLTEQTNQQKLATHEQTLLHAEYDQLAVHAECQEQDQVYGQEKNQQMYTSQMQTLESKNLTYKNRIEELTKETMRLEQVISQQKRVLASSLPMLLDEAEEIGMKTINLTNHVNEKQAMKIDFETLEQSRNTYRNQCMKQQTEKELLQQELDKVSNRLGIMEEEDKTLMITQIRGKSREQEDMTQKLNARNTELVAEVTKCYQDIQTLSTEQKDANMLIRHYEKKNTHREFEDMQKSIIRK